MRFFVVPAGIVLAMAGCATEDQLRQTEAQQGQAVQALRAGADRSESVISDLRAEIRRTQDSVHALEGALTDARARADAAKVQADGALSTSREFLANLLAAREEQRRQLDENGVAFSDFKRKTAYLESRLQAQQLLIDQGNVVLNNAIRRLTVIEAGLQEASRRSTLLEAQGKAGQETDNGLTRQLAKLSKQVEETRAVIGSEGLLQMMRELEDERRDSATLRGSIEELQKAQMDSATQARNFYLDLDTRIQALKKAQADFATQDKGSYLDLDTRIQALKKAQADFATQDKSAYLDLDTRIQALKKAQADFAAQARNFYLDFDTRIQALKQKLLAAASEGKVSAPAGPLPATTSESAVAPAAEPDHPASQ
jgi:TolA binding protein trimerisation